jgi:hypothetical protein
LLLTSLCFWLRNAKAKGNAKAKDAKAKDATFARSLTTFARSLTKAREATFAFGYATQRQKERQKGRTFSLPFAFASRRQKQRQGECPEVAQRISKGGKRQAKAKGKQLMPAAHKQGRQKATQRQKASKGKRCKRTKNKNKRG